MIPGAGAGQRLSDFVTRVAREPSKNAVRQLDEGTRQRLRALGYAE